MAMISVVHQTSRFVFIPESETYYTIDGKPGPPSIWDDLAGVYPTKNRGYVRIHTNFLQ